MNNGLLIFEVQKTTDTDVICKVLAGGEMSDRKSMSFPNKVLKQAYLSEQDKADLLFGIQQDVDFIACSFVSCRQDLLDMRAFLEANGATDIELIAKIENQSGIDNFEEICQECSGIMIGRGGMGVEIPFEELPAIQKHLITKCRLLGKRAITATEMLDSMIRNPRPTRAEVSDVANAVYDGTSAIMLSGETAAGKYPVLTVQTMARIAEKTEESINYRKRFVSAEFKIKKYGGCHLPRHLRHGNRHRSQRHHGLLLVRHDGPNGVPVPPAGGYSGPDYLGKDVAQAGPCPGVSPRRCARCTTPPTCCSIPPSTSPLRRSA